MKASVVFLLLLCLHQGVVVNGAFGVGGIIKGTFGWMYQSQLGPPPADSNTPPDQAQKGSK